ncbi:hypothetical protein PHYBOEH_007598 [Phytophthora boehmeriae]|uniref:EF-hand domain-containing protein n=1 Tax=Phytophthora boehmeriae TaxID=109152 RepID=A0A8T1X0W1_9STRA|nr:hypothetical protein PHYBOEH_007598 [Phytophthora boehmeriae]
MVAQAAKTSGSRESSSAVSSPSVSDLDEDSNESSESPSSDSENSNDSEADSVPSIRRTRVSRTPRHRWRKAQSSKTQSTSTSALLPPAEPECTSLWTTREKQFEKFRSSMLAMPVPDGVTRIEKCKGYSLHVMSVLNWVLPDSVLHTSAIPAARGVETTEDDEEEPLITLGVHVSLFHSPSKRFFGNTWVSPELAVDPFQIKQVRHPKDGTLRYVIENALLNFRAYFISDVIDPSCVGVLELVAYEKDPDSKATVRVVGCGWTLLPLFARQQAVQSGGSGEASSVPSAFSMNTSGDSVSVFTGSPRALWDLNPTAWNAQEKHEGCKFYYQLVPYEPMLSIAMFLRKNELVGALDPIPGLKNGNLANIDMGKNPKLLLREEADTTYEETLASYVKIASLVPKSVQVENPFELTVIATRVAINLREEIEANLVDRLAISRKAVYEGATSVEGEVSARVLKIALHNGRCFRTRQFTVPLKADPSGGDTLLCVRNSSKLRGFVFHPNMAIIVVLQYTVHFRIVWSSKLKQQALEAKKPPLPEEDVILITMGARALVPSDGKKLYLYDKHHNATAISTEPLTTLGGVLLQEHEEQRRVLHVDLLSGPSCRPYSDNTLYTPPDQVAKSLQSRHAGAKDSFAFCDLKITIDGELPGDSSTEEVEVPPSPAKPSVDEDNQAGEENCAAEEWARKLLGKANSNPVLAQALNALATTPTQDKCIPESPPKRPPSPVKKQNADRSANLTPLVSDAPTLDLSRASKTLLTRYGYMESHDKQPLSPTNNQKTHDKRKLRKKVDIRLKSINIEVNDTLKANEVRFHFAAYRACSPNAEVTADMPCEPAPARVYFTFQFYKFAPTRTETLRLSRAFDNGAGGDIQTFLLMRENPSNKPSLAIQFDVDTTATQNPLETRRFVEYLKWNNLYVDVWDADSLFQLGTFAIPLHELLRQGSGVKKFQAEIEIAPPLASTLAVDHYADGEDAAVCVVPEKSGINSASIGRIQLLMSNYGLRGEHFIEQVAPSKPDVSPPSGPQGPLASVSQQVRPSKHRVRARPLVESNEELHRLLTQEGYYGDRRGATGKNSQARTKQNLQSVGDLNTLTPKELGILCELFRSRKIGRDVAHSTGHRSTRIKCDMEGKTGLLALLSLKPPEAVATSVGPPTKPTIDQPVVVSNNAKQEVDTNQVDTAASDHAERLKRVMAIATKNHVALTDAFSLFDSNKDGFLSREEFVHAMRSLGTVFDDLSDADLGLLADFLDTNKDGKVEYQEFDRFLTKDKQHKGMSKAEWRDHIKRIVVRAMEKGVRVHHVFAELDASGDGKLSLEEFEQGLYKLGVSPDSVKQGIRELLNELDKDQDGTISYKEFLESLGISIEENKREVVKETVKDIREDVCKILKRLAAKGVRFEDVFVHFDTDRNGTLSVNEFTKALNKLFQLEFKGGEDDQDTLKAFEKDAVEAFVRSINADGDSKIDYCEFLTACGVDATEMHKRTAQFQQTVRDKTERKLIKLIVRACAGGLSVQDVFEQFDSNSDGNISLEEFQATIEKLFVSQGLTTDDAALVASRFDTNGDGTISRQEFQDFWNKLQKKQQSLTALLTPHLSKLSALDQSSKLAGKIWAQFCREELGATPRTLSTEVMPLLSFFGFEDEDGNVDVPELCALCKTVQTLKASTRKSGKESAVKQLQTLLTKAKEQGVDLKKSFTHFDANGDGEISRDELKRGLLALGCFNDMKEEDFDLLLERLDEDGSGKIDFREFRALMNNSREGSAGADDKEELMNKLKVLMEKAVEKGVSIDDCFAHFDKDGDGNIKREEFMTAMTELGFAADQSVINGVIKLLDRNGSGTISLSEFKQLFPAVVSSTPQMITPATTQDPVDQQSSAALLSESSKKKSPRDDMKVTLKLSSSGQTAQEKLHTLLLSAGRSGVDVKQCFAHFDVDGNEVITKDEFVGAMKQLPGFEAVSDDDILAIAKDLDKDNSGSVSLVEFEEFLRKPEQKSAVVDAEEQPPQAKAAPGANSEAASAPLPQISATTDTVVMQKIELSPDEFQPANDGDESLPPTVNISASSEGLMETTPEQSSNKAQEPTSSGASPEVSAVQTESTALIGEEMNIDAPVVVEAAPSAETTRPEKALATKTPPERIVRAGSFGKEKSPGTTDTGVLFRRTITDSEAISADVGSEAQEPEKRKAPPQRTSFASARASQSAQSTIPTSSTKDSSMAEPNVLEKAAADGLTKLKKFLITATDRGVAIQQSFNHFDKAEKGTLSYEEFEKGLRDLGADFASFRSEDIVAMAKSLDKKQQNEIRVEDFVSLMEEPAPKEIVVEVEKPSESSKEDSQSPMPKGQAEEPAPTKRPPPLRRTGSTQLPTKTHPRPSSGIQSARSTATTAVELARTSEEDKPGTTTSRIHKALQTDKDEAIADASPSATAPTMNEVSNIGAALEKTIVNAAGHAKGGIEANLDCNYTFHSDPEIRAVELKLRQTALDAYQRGILPLRVVAKFLEGDEDPRERIPGDSGRKHCRKKKGELLRVEFLQVLMELGFTLLSDQDNQDDDGANGGLPRPMTRMNDHLYARQLERLSRYKQHIKSEESKAHKQLVRAVAKSKQHQRRGNHLTHTVPIVWRTDVL